jgi:hypothetical protein
LDTRFNGRTRDGGRPIQRLVSFFVSERSLLEANPEGAGRGTESLLDRNYITKQPGRKRRISQGVKRDIEVIGTEKCRQCAEI